MNHFGEELRQFSIIMLSLLSRDNRYVGSIIPPFKRRMATFACHRKPEPLKFGRKRLTQLNCSIHEVDYYGTPGCRKGKSFFSFDQSGISKDILCKEHSCTAPSRSNERNLSVWPTERSINYIFSAPSPRSVKYIVLVHIFNSYSPYYGQLPFRQELNFFKDPLNGRLEDCASTKQRVD